MAFILDGSAQKPGHLFGNDLGHAALYKACSGSVTELQQGFLVQTGLPRNIVDFD